MKVSELEGADLDYWVAKAEGEIGVIIVDESVYVSRARYSPSTKWSQGGPIIEREELSIGKTHGLGFSLETGKEIPNSEWFSTYKYGFVVGPTPLIAAMRAFVASKFGEGV